MRFFILVLLTVCFLRLFDFSATPSGLYWDELDSGYQAYSLLKTGKDYFGNVLPAHIQSFADYRSGLYMYLTVPFVKFLGLSTVSVRITAVIFSLLTLPVLFYLSRKLLNLPIRYCWIAPAIWGLSPWTLIQGRIAAESMLMPFLLLLGLALYLHYISTKQMLFLIFSGFFFGLSLWSYGAAKTFLPIFLLLIFILNKYSKHPKIKPATLLLPLVVFLVVSALPVVEIFNKNVSMRFNELSVFTDPTTESEIDYRRLESALGRKTERIVGMQPELAEKIYANKISYWVEKVGGNYLKSLSTTFLFTTGDPQLRHNINMPNIGQFYPVELITFLVGLFAILNFKGSKRGLKIFLILWIIVAPLSAAVTRDGGYHAPRLLPLLAPIVFIISIGTANILNRTVVGKLYLLTYLVFVFTAGFYFFGTYRIRSANSFNTGFVPAVEFAILESEKYDHIILDGHNESFLMAYLFTSAYDPKTFQNSFPLPAAAVDTGVEGYRFGKFHILYPGTRDWNVIKSWPNSLIISSTTQANTNNIKPLNTFSNPDGSAALIAFIK